VSIQFVLVFKKVYILSTFFHIIIIIHHISLPAYPAKGTLAAVQRRGCTFIHFVKDNTHNATSGSSVSPNGLGGAASDSPAPLYRINGGWLSFDWL
jgi:hypothetical protein